MILKTKYFCIKFTRLIGLCERERGGVGPNSVETSIGSLGSFKCQHEPKNNVKMYVVVLGTKNISVMLGECIVNSVSHHLSSCSTQLGSQQFKRNTAKHWKKNNTNSNDKHRFSKHKSTTYIYKCDFTQLGLHHWQPYLSIKEDIQCLMNANNGSALTIPNHCTRKITSNTSTGEPEVNILLMRYLFYILVLVRCVIKLYSKNIDFQSYWRYGELLLC